MTNGDMDKKLCESYPKIFRDRRAPIQKSLMGFGFEVGAGWYNILDSLCHLIQWKIDQSRKDRLSALRFNRALGKALNGDKRALTAFYTYGPDGPGAWALKAIEDDIKEGKFKPVWEVIPQVVATQVKEKFGTLRFYYYGGDEYISGAVHMAENMSGVTCEVCGSPGKSNEGGWIKVRCEEHEND